MRKISDYKISFSTLNNICNVLGEKCINFFVELDSNLTSPVLSNNQIRIPPSTNWAQTNYFICAAYLNNINTIYGRYIVSSEHLNYYLILSSSIFRQIYYAGDHINVEPVKLSVYNYPLLWNVMKNIICPLFNKDLSYIDIYEVDDPYMDIACFYPKNEKLDEPAIFVNNLGNDLIKNVFLFLELLKSCNLVPSLVLKDIFTSEIYEQFYGCLLLALSEQEAEYFVHYLISYMDDENTSEIFAIKKASKNNKISKESQMRLPEKGHQFWFLGLTELMMEPVRKPGSDVYQALEQEVKEFWDKVEGIKKKQGKKEVPFDQLLAIRNYIDNKGTDSNTALQKLLADDRVW